MDTLAKGNLDQDDEVLRDLFQRSVTEPSPGLKEKIFHELQNCTDEVFEYEPVISSKAWMVIGGAFTALVGFLLYKSSSPMFSFMEIDGFDFSFFTRWSAIADQGARWFGTQQIQIPFASTVAIAALVLFGIHFMVSYRYWRQLFRFPH